MAETLSSLPIQFRSLWCRPAKRWVSLATAKRLARLRHDAGDSVVGRETSAISNGSRSRPLGCLGEVQDALGDGIALDLGGARPDGGRPSGQIADRPAASLRCLRSAGVQHGVRAGDGQGEFVQLSLEL